MSQCPAGQSVVLNKQAFTVGSAAAADVRLPERALQCVQLCLTWLTISVVPTCRSPLVKSHQSTHASCGEAHGCS